KIEIKRFPDRHFWHGGYDKAFWGRTHSASCFATRSWTARRDHRATTSLHQGLASWAPWVSWAPSASWAPPRASPLSDFLLLLRDRTSKVGCARVHSWPSHAYRIWNVMTDH